MKGKESPKPLLLRLQPLGEQQDRATSQRLNSCLQRVFILPYTDTHKGHKQAGRSATSQQINPHPPNRKNTPQVCAPAPSQSMCRLPGLTVLRSFLIIHIPAIRLGKQYQYHHMAFL